MSTGSPIKFSKGYLIEYDMNIFKVHCSECDLQSTFDGDKALTRIHALAEVYLSPIIECFLESGCTHFISQDCGRMFDDFCYFFNVPIDLSKKEISKRECRDCKKNTKDMDNYHTSKRDNTILCHDCFTIRLAKGQVKEKPEEQECLT